MINSALWYALTRNLARILSERRPADTRALLLRDARATWLARGCTVEQWELIYLVETGLMHLDISGEDR